MTSRPAMLPSGQLPGGEPGRRAGSRLAAARRHATAILRSRRVLAPGLTLAIVAAALPIGASPANAAIEPVTPPHAIEVFPAIDMVGAAGFDDPFVVEVWRDGVKVGTSGEPVETDLLELNHDGPPCWSGTTPDIMAGDQIRVITDASDPADPVGEFMTVADLDAETPELVALDADGVANDIVMRGRALTDDGTAPLPIARMAAEIVQPAFRDSSQGWDRRAIGAAPGGQLPAGDTVFDQDDSGVLAYDPVGPANPDGSRWTATWKNLPAELGELALTGEHTIQAWERDDPGGEGVGLTIMDAEDASGPGTGCPAASADAVTDSSHRHVNLAAEAAGGDLVLSGTAYNAAAVNISIDDADGSSADAVTVEAAVNQPAATTATSVPVPGRHQTWTARVPMAALTGGDLADGDLTVAGTYDRVVEERVEVTPDPATPDDPASTLVTYSHTAQPISGRAMVIGKDLVAPQPPTVFPPGGVYYGAQTVTATADDAAMETIRYAVGGAAAAEPTAASPVLPTPYTVSSSQQLKVAAYDRAGNRSGTVTQAYDMRQLGVPGAPGRPTGVAGNGSVRVSWTPPADTGGHPITAYAVRAFDSAGRIVRSTEVAASTTTTALGALSNGRGYTVDVRALNAVGTGVPSVRSVTLVPRTEFVAPRLAAGSPGANASAVAQGANVMARFTEPVSGVNTATMRLVRAGTTTAVRATVSYNAAKRTATLNPVSPLARDARYTVLLTGGIRDAAGNALAATSWSFTTGPRPALSARTPGPGATNVRRGTAVAATFTEAVSGVGGATVRLTRAASGAPVAATLAYNPRTRTVTVNPYGGSTTVLAARTTYRVTVTSGVRDAAGNPMSTTSWTFTTGTR
ncbi:MAG TPA: Ig-like domain-containing protein [Pilimelia sp.]|nr:Ig-like domain-containing protein [Pilimelia sp.]